MFQHMRLELHLNPLCTYITRLVSHHSTLMLCKQQQILALQAL